MIKLAKIVSIIFQPIFILLFCALLLYFTTDYFEYYSKLYSIIFFSAIIAFTILVPISIVFYLYKTKKVSNFFISKREERTRIYLISIASTLVLTLILYYFLESILFVYFLIFAISALALITFINLWWKISVHATGMGILSGFVIFLSMLFNYNYLWIFCVVVLLSGLVMSSRCLLKAHSQEQVFAGFFAGLFLTLIPSYIFLSNY